MSPVCFFFRGWREPKPRPICCFVVEAIPLPRELNLLLGEVAKRMAGWPSDRGKTEKSTKPHGVDLRSGNHFSPLKCLWPKNLIMFMFQRVSFGCETWDLYPMFHWLKKCVAIRGTNTLVALFHRQWWFVGSENMCPKDQELPSWKPISTPKALGRWFSFSPRWDMWPFRVLTSPRKKDKKTGQAP